MCNWINKTNVDDAEAASRYGQVAKVTDKLDTSRKNTINYQAIKVMAVGDTSVMSKVGGIGALGRT